MTDDFEPPTPAIVDPIESVDRVESREALAQALCDPLANIGSTTLQPSGSTRLPGEVLKGLNGSRDPRGPQGTAVHRILIVEDSETMRSLMMASLENLESPVKTAKAASGFEALRMLAREPYDLIVTDINMPDINGLELVWFVKRNEQYNSIPVIIVSTEGSERDRDKGLGLGADAYLVKPFDPAELHDVAAELLARASRW
jgi:two-component system chemotaxis response regulator CheY